MSDVHAKDGIYLTRILPDPENPEKKKKQQIKVMDCVPARGGRGGRPA